MTHAEFDARLDDFVDGCLGPAEGQAMEEHANDCRACAAKLAATRALVAQARRLASAIEPGKDEWPLLAQSLAPGASVTRSSGAGGAGISPAAASHASWWRSRAVVSWLVAASLAVCAAGYWVRSRTAVQLPNAQTTADGEAAFTGLMSGLELECLGAGQSLQASFRRPAATRAEAALTAWTPILSDAVSILDRSIAETRSALALAPGDARLQALLATRYQQKLAILNTALVRVDKV